MKSSKIKEVQPPTLGHSVAFVLLDPEGRVQLINREAERLLSLTLSEATKLSPTELFGREITDAILETLKFNSPQTVNSHLETSSKRERIHAQLVPLNKKEPTEPEGVIVLLHSSERGGEPEKELFLEQVANTIAHDFTTPLAAIMGIINLLRQEDPESLKHHHMLPQIMTCAEELSKKILAISNLLRPTNLHLKRKEICTLLLQQEHWLRIPEGKEHIDLQFQIPEAPLSAEVDEKLFYELLSELLFNALDATEETVKVELIDEADQLKIRVTNASKEIPDEQLKQFFKPFFSTTGRPGMGLPEAEKAAMAMGGALRASFKEGNTILTFTLPRKQ